MNRRSFQKLAGARLLDAKALLKAKRYDAAYYVAGYAIECALKACIAKRTRLYDFPPKDGRDFYVHEIEKLLKLADIEGAFWDDLGKVEKLAEYWDTVKDWKPGDRRYDLREAKEAATAAKALLSAIEDRQHGVLQCLSRYWYIDKSKPAASSWTPCAKMASRSLFAAPSGAAFQSPAIGVL